jgi:hypothetical protein
VVQRRNSNKKRGGKTVRDTSSYVDKNSSASDALNALKRLEAHDYRLEPSMTTPVGQGTKKSQTIESGDISLDQRTGFDEKKYDIDLDGQIENIRKEFNYEKQLSEQAVELKLNKLEHSLFEKVGESRDTIKNWFVGIATTLFFVILGSVYHGNSARNVLSEKLNDVRDRVSSNEIKINATGSKSNSIKALKQIAVETKSDGSESSTPSNGSSGTQ